MKKILLFLCCAAIAATTPGCSSKAFAGLNTQKEITLSSNAITKEINVRAFKKLNVSLGNVTVVAGEPTDILTVSAPDNVMEYIEIKSSGSTLSIGRKDNINIRYSKNSKPINITVSASMLSAIDVSLSSTVTVQGKVMGEDIDMDAATSGTITIGEIEVKDLDATVSTSGSIKIADANIQGKADITTSTSGSVKIENANVTAKAELESSTSGSVNIGMLKTNKLTADASTSGSIKISGGTAQYADLEASTSGSISCSKLSAATGEASASTGGSISCDIKSVEITKSLGGSVKNHKK